jgi:hypothetical protein
MSNEANLAELIVRTNDLIDLIGLNADPAMTTLAGKAADLTALGLLTTEIEALGTAVAAIEAVASDLGGDNDIGTVATDLSGDNDIGAVAAAIASISAVEAALANIGTVATDLGGDDDIGTVATAIANLNALAAIIADISTVAGVSANVTTVASNIAAVNAAVSAAARQGFRNRFGKMPPAMLGFDLGDTSLLALTRATAGFRNTDGGGVESKAIDAVRITHDPVTGEPLGLLLEPQQTNHHITSNSLNGNGVVRCTVVDDDEVAPDGTTTAGTMTETTDTGSHGAGASGGKFTIASAGAFYCLSAYVKDVGANPTKHSTIIYAAPFSGATGNWHGWQWDFATETITPYQPANENVTVGYDKLANDWYRLWATRAPSDASGSAGVGFSFQNDGGSYLGDTDNSMAVWGIMLEEVESQESGPSSVILTDGSEVTRSADLATVDLSAISAFRPNGFSVLVEAEIRDTDGVLLAIGTGSTNEIALEIAAGELHLTGADGLDLTAASGLSPGDRIVAALRVGTDDVAVSVNGAACVADGAHVINGAADALQLGANIDGSSGLSCVVQQVAIFGPLPNAILEAMSNG